MTNIFEASVRAAACAALGLTCALVAQDQSAMRAQDGKADYCSLSKVIGANVRMQPGAEARREAAEDNDAAKQPEGKIQDVVIDGNDGSLDYAVVSFGGFIGIGDKTVAVPMSALTWVPAHERFELAASEDRLRALPDFDLGDARKRGLDNAYTTLQEQWRTTAVADASGKAGEARDASGSKLERDAREAGREVREETKEAGREVKEAGREVKEEAKEAGRDIKEAGREAKEDMKEAGRDVRDGARDIGRGVKGDAKALEGTPFYLVPARFMCASEVDDYAVYAGAEKFGSISDVLVDRSKRDVSLVVVKRGGALGMGGTEYLVPFKALNHCTSGDERVHCLNFDLRQLDSAVVYEKPKNGVVEAEAAKRALQSETFGRGQRLHGENLDDKNRR